VILNGWGDVSMCCYQLHQLGNVLGGKTVLDIWNSPTAREIREHTNQGKLHPICTSWNTCPFLVQKKWDFEFKVNQDFNYPTYLEICLPNTHCNIGGENPNADNPACIMCCRNYDMKKQPNITHILCEKSKCLMPYLRYLCVLGTAEPFWKDAVFDVFDQLEFHKYKHRITFTTNCNVTCLVEKTINRFFDEVQQSDMSFSIDAASEETYMKIRRIDGYNLVLNNLKMYMKARDQHGGCDRHKAVIYNNINLLNVHEMVKMVETAAMLRMDRIIMLPTHDQCGRVEMGELLLNDKNLKLFKKHSEAAQRRAVQLGVNLHYSHPFDSVPPPVGQTHVAAPPNLVQIQVKDVQNN
jgi:hypothetical protein